MSVRQTLEQEIYGKMNSKISSTIAFVGLGAMGFGMASHLVKVGYRVMGFDVYEPTRARFLKAGGRIAQSPRDAARVSDSLICMVANSQQADSALFDPENGAVGGICPFAKILFSLLRQIS